MKLLRDIFLKKNETAINELMESIDFTLLNKQCRQLKENYEAALQIQNNSKASADAVASLEILVATLSNMPDKINNLSIKKAVEIVELSTSICIKVGELYVNILDSQKEDVVNLKLVNPNNIISLNLEKMIAQFNLISKEMFSFYMWIEQLTDFKAKLKSGIPEIFDNYLGLVQAICSNDTYNSCKNKLNETRDILTAENFDEDLDKEIRDTIRFMNVQRDKLFSVAKSHVKSGLWHLFNTSTTTIEDFSTYLWMAKTMLSQSELDSVFLAAAASKKPSYMEALVECGANLRAVSEARGCNALHIIVVAESILAMEVMLKMSCEQKINLKDLDVPDKSGMKPSEYLKAIRSESVRTALKKLFEEQPVETQVDRTASALRAISSSSSSTSSTIPAQTATNVDFEQRRIDMS